MYITVRASTYYSYYFAEGCTRDGFAEWLCPQNPGADPLEVSATYMLEGGQAPVFKTYPLSPSSRTSVQVNGEVGPGQDVSVKLSANGEFLAERPMYFDYSGVGSRDWTGGSCVMGAPAPGKRYYFAEGTTRNVPSYGEFKEWLTLQNPGTQDCAVEITYLTLEAGVKGSCKVIVPAGTRHTVYVNEQAGPGLQLSAQVVSDKPVVTERPMYFNYNGA